MSRYSDPTKHTTWLERFERFSGCGLTVARFCAREHVSTASFYMWRKKLKRELRRSQAEAGSQGAFCPVEVIPSPAGLAAASVSIHLSNGTRIDVPVDQLDTVRAVVGEVVRADIQRSSALC